MVSTSLVMLFEPSTKADHDKIQDIYEKIDCRYPLTIHCTIGYY